MVDFHYLADGIPAVDPHGIMKPSRDRAMPLSPFIAEIAAANKDVAAAVAKLDAALAAIAAEVDRMADLEDEFESYKKAARAGTTTEYRADEYWQARADAIRDEHAAAVRAGVATQNEVVRAARPFEAAFLAADRKRIRDLADELSVLTGRATRWTGDTVVVRGFQKIAPVREVIEAIRHIGTYTPLGHPYEGAEQ